MQVGTMPMQGLIAQENLGTIITPKIASSVMNCLVMNLHVNLFLKLQRAWVTSQIPGWPVTRFHFFGRISVEVGSIWHISRMHFFVVRLQFLQILEKHVARLALVVLASFVHFEVFGQGIVESKCLVA